MQHPGTIVGTPKTARRNGGRGPSWTAVIFVLLGLIAPPLHDLSHGADVLAAAAEARSGCERHPAGAHVETGYSHLHNAPCVVCSRTLAAVVLPAIPVTAPEAEGAARQAPLVVHAVRSAYHPTSRGPPVLA